MVGQEVTIYGDSLINVPIGNPLVVTYTCDIGTQVGNNLVITPEAGDIGNHSLRMVFKNGSYTIEDKTITLNVYAEASAGNISVLLIGDSTTANGISYIKAGVDAVTAQTITYIGTKGTTIKHEGIPGATWLTMVSSGSPFYKGGAVDVASYFTDNSLATPDYVVIRLGVNDMLHQSQYDPLTSLPVTMARAKQLIDGFLAYDASLKIIIALPTICENSGTGWNTSYDESVYIQDRYIDYIHQLWDAYIDEFDAGVYDARVLVSAEEAVFLDRNDGYSKTAGVHDNGVHPDESGYNQIGNGIAIYLNKLYNEATAFTITVKTDNAGSAADTFVLPTTGAGYDCVVYWGDGTATAHAGTPGNISHTYPAAGTYTIRVNGTFPRIYFNNAGDKAKLITINHWGNIVWTSMLNAFYGCSEMQGAWTDAPDLSTASMSTRFMFYGCAKFNWPVVFDTSTVIDMNSMFLGCTIFNQSVASFDTSLCQNFFRMFYKCSAFKQSLATFSLAAMTEIGLMLQYSNLNATGTTTNYDATLVAWAAADVPNSKSFHGGYSKYSDTGQTARQSLIDDDLWSIDDGGHI